MFPHYYVSRVLRMMAATARPWVIFVLGGPGAGKGTQCANIVRVSSAISPVMYTCQLPT